MRRKGPSYLRRGKTTERKRMLLVHVPARGGSKGLPGKNLRTVGGRTLVRRAVEVGRAFLENAGLAGRVLVDTDDEQIAEEGRRAGAWVPFLRPESLAQDSTTTIETVLHAVARLEEMGNAIDTLLLLQPTSPLRSIEDVEACWAAFDPGTRPSVVSVVALTHPPELTLRIDAESRVHWAFGAPPPGVRRQDLAPTYRPNGAVYIDALEFLRRERNFVVEGQTVGVPMPAERSIDIDDALDLQIAEAMLGAMKRTGEETSMRGVDA